MPPSQLGYSMKHLKQRLSQAVLYIRPPQRDLDETLVIHKVNDVTALLPNANVRE